MTLAPFYYNLGDGCEAFSTYRDSVLPYHVITGHQVHGSAVAIVDRPDLTREELEGIDALVTNKPGVAIGVRTADCVPVLLFDPEQRAVAAVHSGWKGTIQRIAEKAIFTMGRQFGSKASSLRAVIGPAIGPQSFQVGEEAKTRAFLLRPSGSSTKGKESHRCTTATISISGKRTGGS